MDSLPERLIGEIIRAGTIMTYDDGQLIHNRGDMKRGISIVVSGSVKVGIYGEDGSFVMTTQFGPGQTFGEFTLFVDLPRTHDVSASGPTQINQISAAVFNRLYEAEPDIARALLTTSLIRTHRLLEMMDAMRRLPMRERVAKAIFTLTQMDGGLHTFECRQSDLAFTLGVSRASLSTALKQLSDIGLIKLGYGHIQLLDTDRMRTWVAENCSA